MDDKDRLAGMPPSIGRYQIVDSIGVGAMGAVYKAFDPLIKRTLAIKTIRLDIPRGSPQYKSFIERFYHEARISGTLSHPNIVTLFDIGEENGLPFLAMEFVEGDTIAALVERGQRFKPEKVINLVSQIASAIDYAHTKGVIHRDIKPSNIILAEGDRVKVTDFGIAKLVDAEMTQSGQLLGTPSYMSPEQAMGDKLDGRSDIFSLGVCAFEMLSGEQPFPGNNVTSILYKLVHVEPVQPAGLEMNGLVPQKWHEVFSKVLAKRPDDRYQTASDFVQDLEYCLGSWFGSAMGEGEDDEDPLQAMTMAPGTKAPEALRTPPRPAAHTVPPGPEGGEAKTIIMGSAAAKAAAAKVAAEAIEVDLDEDLSAPSPVAVAEAGEIPTVALPAVGRSPAAPSRAAAGEERTILMGASGVPPIPRPAARAVPPPLPRAPVPVTVTAPQPPLATPARPKKGLPLAAIFGGLSLMALLMLGVVLFLYLRSRAGAPQIEASPAVASPLPSATASAPAGAMLGTLRVETEPAGASVSVDGQPRGVTPLEVPGLPFGAHELKLELAGYDAQMQQFTVAAESPRAELKFTLGRAAPGEGTADITSSPPGATVTVDGAPAGVTPLAGVSLKAGRHRVQLAKEGYETWSGTFTVQGGRTARLDRTLQAVAPLATPTPGPRVQPVDTSRTYENRVGDVDVPARRLTGSTASYPDRAPRLRSGQEVAVAVSFVVDEEGQVTDLQVTESAGNLVDQAVMQAIRSWRYSPATKRGTTVKVRVQFRQRFRAG